MSYLLDFVKSFTEEELKQFKRLDLIGREEEVRDVYALHATDKEFNEAKLPALLSLTQSHFDKINSILLDKAIEQLYRSDYSLALYTILHKGLSDLVLHELKILERKTGKKNNQQATIKFYKAAFDCLRSMYHPKYDPELTRLYGKKYLKALGDKRSIAEECYVAMITLYGDIISANFSGHDKDFQPVAWQKLEEWRKRIADYTNPIARFYYHYVLGVFYKHLTEDAESFIKACEAALAAYDQTKGELEQRYKGVLLCELGFGYMASGRYAESQKKYADAIVNYNDTVGKSTYHPANYLTVCIINRDFKTAGKLFESYLLPKIQASSNRSMVFDIYHLAGWLYLSQRKMDLAYKWLNELNRFRKNEVTLYGQAMLRHLETTYYYIAGDDIVTARLVKRNLKFLKKQTITFDYYTAYIDIIGKLLSLKQNKLRSAERLQLQVNGLQQGLYRVWNLILEEELLKLQPKLAS
ncbi:MAG TPA: hypothetical protein VG603_07855 [Chitinophagales bacterium]|nr:hypothetical protein [Chitinophagales bacterium]